MDFSTNLCTVFWGTRQSALVRLHSSPSDRTEDGRGADAEPLWQCPGSHLPDSLRGLRPRTSGGGQGASASQIEQLWKKVTGVWAKSPCRESNAAEVKLKIIYESGSEHLPKPRRSELLEFSRARPKPPSGSQYIFKHQFSKCLPLFWNILEDFMPTSWTLLSLRTLLSWVNKWGDGFKLYKQANIKPMSMKQALQNHKTAKFEYKRLNIFESQINKPFDSAGDCQWRNKALK